MTGSGVLDCFTLFAMMGSGVLDCHASLAMTGGEGIASLKRGDKRGRDSGFFVLLGILFSNYSIMALPKGIQVFGPSKLSNAAYGEFMKVVARLITRGTCEKLGVDAAAFTGFQSHLARLVEITKELRQQKETLELNDLDRERDGLLVYLL